MRPSSFELLSSAHQLQCALTRPNFTVVKWLFEDPRIQKPCENNFWGAKQQLPGSKA